MACSPVPSPLEPIEGPRGRRCYAAFLRFHRQSAAQRWIQQVATNPPASRFQGPSSSPSSSSSPPPPSYPPPPPPPPPTPPPPPPILLPLLPPFPPSIPRVRLTERGGARRMRMVALNRSTQRSMGILAPAGRRAGSSPLTPLVRNQPRICHSSVACDAGGRAGPSALTANAPLPRRVYRTCC